MLTPPPFPRSLAPEILDTLQEDDPRAVRSRRDLQRINRIMGSAAILGGELERRAAAPVRIIELGAGDGTLSLRLAKRLAPAWPAVQIVLLDRQHVAAQSTLDEYARLGWHARTLVADIEEWAESAGDARYDIAIANLFIHHFPVTAIGRIFAAVGACADLFVACEPRRARTALVASNMVGLIGANDVTRCDAVLSVKAGFRDSELSGLWPHDPRDWNLAERRAGLYSHLFMAQRRNGHRHDE
ncbi:MAG TPA: class I SAM-dependent methyltransferase [Rubrivivax sp.]|nr:class I SAM-dependent methyltransferase [Rubrivivax sp.]